jgi:ribosomal protein S27AE
MEWPPPKEKDEPTLEKQDCKKCGNDTFRVYIKIIIDDARLYCAKCGALNRFTLYKALNK